MIDSIVTSEAWFCGVTVVVLLLMTWEFPKIGDPNLVP